MVKVTLNGKYKISIKTCFEECKVSELEKIGKTSEELILALTDCSTETYEKLSSDSIDFILTILAFIQDYDNLTLPEPEKQVDVGDEAFYKIEQAKQILGGGKQSIQNLIALARLYMGDKWMNKNENLVPKVLSQAIQVFHSIEVFLDRHKELNEHFKDDDDEEYEEAGIESIQSYGVFATIYSLTDGKPWLYNRLVNCSAESVYMTLRFSRDKAQFDKNLLQIKKRKAGGSKLSKDS